MRKWSFNLPEYFKDIFIIEIVEVDAVIFRLEQIDQVSLHLALLYYLSEYPFKEAFEKLFGGIWYFDLFLYNFRYYDGEAGTELGRGQIYEQVVQKRLWKGAICVIPNSVSVLAEYLEDVFILSEHEE